MISGRTAGMRRRRIRTVPPPFARRFAGSSAIEAIRTAFTTRAAALACSPLAPMNAPVPPLTACGASPPSISRPISWPLALRISYLHSAIVPWVTSAMAEPAAAVGLKPMVYCRDVHKPLAGFP